jgi:ABC-type Zn uptake system ZnuABC Zn-binding protein ZnuA
MKYKVNAIIDMRGKRDIRAAIHDFEYILSRYGIKVVIIEMIEAGGGDKDA